MKLAKYKCTGRESSMNLKIDPPVPFNDGIQGCGLEFEIDPFYAESCPNCGSLYFTWVNFKEFENVYETYRSQMSSNTELDIINNIKL